MAVKKLSWREKRIVVNLAYLMQDARKTGEQISQENLEMYAKSMRISSDRIYDLMYKASMLGL